MWDIKSIYEMFTLTKYDNIAARSFIPSHAVPIWFTHKYSDDVNEVHWSIYVNMISLLSGLSAC